MNGGVLPIKFLDKINRPVMTLFRVRFNRSPKGFEMNASAALNLRQASDFYVNGHVRFDRD